MILETLDMFGRRIQTFVSEFQKAGIYSVNFNVSQLSSGVYFSKLQVGNGFVEVEKILLIR